MKKMITTLLCLVMVLCMLTGCGPTANTETTGSAADTTGTSDEQITLTIGLPTNINTQDYDTNALTSWLEETTGYNIEFMPLQASSSDYGSQISTMMISGEDLPDILWGVSLGDDVYEDYGEDGYFIDLYDYFYDMEKSQVWWDSFEQLDEQFQADILRTITTEDGAIYVFPHIEETEIDVIDSMIFYNKAWLDKLGLDVPTDTESLYEVLKAFKTQDPNGNGKPDELGIIGRSNSNGKDITDWIINMFTFYNSEKTFNIGEDGKLYAPAVTDDYREALIYIKKLVSEGLIDQGCWSMKNADMKGLINPGEGVDVTVGAFLGHPTLLLEPNHSSVYDYVAGEFFGNVIMNENQNNYTTFITSACENPDAAWDLLMTMASPEGAKRMRYGEKGVDWDEADAGTTSFLGYEAEIKVINDDAFSGQNNQTWHHVGATILRNAENEATQLSDDTDQWSQAKLALLKDLHDNAWAAYEANNRNADVQMPKIILNDEQDSLTLAERTNCQDFIESSRASFCCGTGDYNDPSDDAQWAAYLAELEKMGLQTWLDQYQTLYEEQCAE